MQVKHKGSKVELLACAHLLDQDYEVFKNVSNHGIADLVVWKPETNDVIFYDVKSISPQFRANGEKRYSPTAFPKATEEQRKFGVKILLYDPETGTFN